MNWSHVMEAVRRLSYGEEVAFVVYEGRPDGAIRVHVARPIDREETGYDVTLQRFTAASVDWERYSIKTEEWEYGYMPNQDVGDLPRLFRFYEVVVETETPRRFEKRSLGGTEA